MSRATSATTGRRYGLERVCRMWERSRSALYARRARLQCRKRGDGPARRGPTPALSDAQLLAAIRSDLARSPFQGEGHRKVHARLRILDGVRVSRTRVLRVMRAQGQLHTHLTYSSGRSSATAHMAYNRARPTSSKGMPNKMPKLSRMSVVDAWLTWRMKLGSKGRLTPHLGHDFAYWEISVVHSRHFCSAMATPPCGTPGGRKWSPGRLPHTPTR